jgi:hypothetical protein
LAPETDIVGLVAEVGFVPRTDLVKTNQPQRQISNLYLSILDQTIIKAGFGQGYRLFPSTKQNH